MNNRVIKFRIYIAGKMAYAPFGFWIHDGEFFTHLEGLKISSKQVDGPAEITGQVMQYTGLKDKNGKEIYEGDFVKTLAGRIRVIEWSYKASGFRFPNKPTMYISSVGEIEVIGNIYENPELLKQK